MLDQAWSSIRAMLKQKTKTPTHDSNFSSPYVYLVFVFSCTVDAPF